MKSNKIKAQDASEIIIDKVFKLRGERIMLEEDVAALFETDLKIFRQKVSRNSKRFPTDFRFIPTAEEWQNLQLQMGATMQIGNKTIPAVFTESGVLMASGIIKSNRAVKISIQIINQFCSLLK
jgi:hypothetical protein